MTLEQKAGQLFTQAFYGTHINPDAIRSIKELNCGGLRVTSFWKNFRRYARPGEERASFEKASPRSLRPYLLDDRKDKLCYSMYLPLDEYTGVMNRLKEIASERSYDAPLHLALDQEGDYSADVLRGGVNFFPSPWGIARTGDPDLVYRAAKAVGRQLAAIGFSVIHSPVLDVVTNPASTYIGTRAFGSDIDTVVAMGTAYLKGMREEGVMCCGKHYPGRGSTDVDDHHDVAAIDRSAEEMIGTDLAPYRALIEAGLPMIMIGHSIYPCWDTEHVASCSEIITREITRGQLQFKGIVTTDSMVMGAIAKKYGVPQACLLAAKAGANLILMKECGPIRDEAHRLVVEAARNGTLPEAQLDEQVLTTLRWKADYGLYGENYLKAPKRSLDVVADPDLSGVARDAAEAAAHVVRDEENVLPWAPDRRTLLVEQIPRHAVYANDRFFHPGQLWENLLRFSENISLLEIEENPTNEDREKFANYLPHYDAFIVTHYVDRSVPGNHALVEQALQTGKPTLVVSNSALPYNTPETWPNVVCSGSITPPSTEVVARLLFGRFTPNRPAVSKSFDP
jgi:beta-N-acetylhexosaminidase